MPKKKGCHHNEAQLHLKAEMLIKLSLYLCFVNIFKITLLKYINTLYEMIYSFSESIAGRGNPKYICFITYGFKNHIRLISFTLIRQNA